MEQVTSIIESVNQDVNEVLKDCISYDNKEAVIVLVQLKDGSQLFACNKISHMQKSFLVTFANHIVQSWFQETK